MTPFILAVIEKDLEKCRELLKEELDMNQSTQDNPEKLGSDKYVIQLSRKVVLKLSNYKAKDYKGFEKTTPMFWVIKYTPSLVQDLIDKGFEKDLLVEKGTGMTALMWAVVIKDVSVVKLLLDNGVDLHAPNFYGVRALDLAITGNHPKMVQILIEHGDHAICSKHLESPLPLAIQSNYVNVLELLMNYCEGYDLRTIEIGEECLPLLHYTVATYPETSVPQNFQNDMLLTDHPIELSARYKVVEFLLTNGQVIHYKDRTGRTALQIALCDKKYEVLHLLIEHGANVNERINGTTCLHIAVEMNDKILVKILIDGGADIKAEDANGITPLELGIMRPEFDIELVDIFLDFGVDIKKINKGGNSIYSLAASRHNPKLMKTLNRSNVFCDDFSLGQVENTKQKKPVDASLNNEEKLLLSAQRMFFRGIRQNKFDLVKMALVDGAESRSRSISMPYPLHFAVSKNYFKIVSLLLNKGVYANSLDNNKNSPAKIAVDLDNFKSWIVLLQHGACYEDGIRESNWFDKERGIYLKRIVAERKRSKKNFGEKGAESFDLKEIFALTANISNNFKLPRQTLLSVFFAVNRLFRIVQEGNLSELEYRIGLLDKCVAEQGQHSTSEFYHLVMNTIDKKGRTLLALAVEKGHGAVAQKLIQIRLNLHSCVCCGCGQLV